MDFETVSAEDFGRSLTGVGINLLTRDVRGLCGFLQAVFDAGIHRLSDDFAIVTCGGEVLQIHADGTYHSHPLLSILPENPPRGAGVQFYLFGIDPDTAENRAKTQGYEVLETTADKPHGLRECTILSPEGYAFSPAVSSAR